LQTLALLQKIICSFSLVNKDEKAIFLISEYYGHIVTRYLAINQLKLNSGETFGTYGKILRSDDDKYLILKETKLRYFKKALPMEVFKIEIPKKDSRIRQLSISSICDRVLQTCAVFLLDPFFEAKLHPDIYGFRCGRSTLNAVALLKSVLRRDDTHRLGVLLVDIEKCFDTISHDCIYKYFKLPTIIKLYLDR